MFVVVFGSVVLWPPVRLLQIAAKRPFERLITEKAKRQHLRLLKGGLLFQGLNVYNAQKIQHHSGPIVAGGPSAIEVLVPCRAESTDQGVKITGMETRGYGLP